MGELAISGIVQGRQVRAVHHWRVRAAALITVEEAVERGAELSRRFAPVGQAGPAHHPLKDSITTVMFQRPRGRVGAPLRATRCHREGRG